MEKNWLNGRASVVETAAVPLLVPPPGQGSGLLRKTSKMHAWMAIRRPGFQRRVNGLVFQQALKLNLGGPS
jgi:hypothetical protein